MQGRERAFRHVLEEGKVDQVDVKVNNVELIGTPSHHVNHGEVAGQVRIQMPAVQAQRPGTSRDQPGLGLCFAGGEQRDLVALIDRSISEMGHHPLRAAIQFRRHSLHTTGQRRMGSGFRDRDMRLKVFCPSSKYFWALSFVSSAISGGCQSMRRAPLSLWTG